MVPPRWAAPRLQEIAHALLGPPTPPATGYGSTGVYLPLDQAGAVFSLPARGDRPGRGDVIRFTGTVSTHDGEHKSRNGDVHTVSGSPRRNVRLENGWVSARMPGTSAAVLSKTSMGSQGRTVQRVILGMSAASIPAINMEQMYVSASRARERLRLYTDDDRWRAQCHPAQLGQESRPRPVSPPPTPAAGPARSAYAPTVSTASAEFNERCGRPGTSLRSAAGRSGERT